MKMDDNWGYPHLWKPPFPVWGFHGIIVGIAFLVNVSEWENAFSVHLKAEKQIQSI